jgi:acetyltransferase-like isoleucine patch superfamily enzyme
MLKGDLMRHQPSNEAEVIIGNDVWIGANSILLKGVKISDGAVVGAGSVVTRSIPSYEIWAGIPAKKISERS